MRRHAGVILIVLVALNLRPAVVAVGPLLRQIQDDLDLSGTAAGALTTLPVLFFGSYGLIAPFTRRRPRGETLLVTSMALLVLGLLVRVIPLQPTLFGGALLAGIAISIGNIAVPAIIKRDHPQAITTVTAVYTVAITAGAAVSTGVVVPLQHALGSGWRPPLMLLAIPAALAGIAWLPRLRGVAAATPPPEAGSSKVWRSALAWQVTCFMGLQSLLAYVTNGWLSSVFLDRGLSDATAGYALGLTNLVQAAGALLVPVLARRLRDQRPLVALTVLLTAAGYAGSIWAPAGSVWLWIVILGLGQGLGFATALSFIGLRTSDPHMTAQLSGMAQGVGYVIAALGPLAVGAVHDATHGWTAPGVLVLAVSAVMLVPGLGAGRDRMVGEEAAPADRHTAAV
ncbi:CynX/NimT family MFS transporter [Actinoallomurus sp. CA-142502]|uniref:CynX/NimT family MFS transporter n=1 Tax=Actinoallomurus sp. CA-142502 TaxID=3239885 RepID=UPI003D8AB3EE